MSGLGRFFHPWVNAALAGLAALAVLAWITSDVQARHDVRKLSQALCETKLELRMKGNPLADRYVLPDDPCAALRQLQTSTMARPSFGESFSPPPSVLRVRDER